ARRELERVRLPAATAPGRRWRSLSAGRRSRASSLSAASVAAERGWRCLSSLRDPAGAAHAAGPPDWFPTTERDDYFTTEFDDYRISCSGRLSQRGKQGIRISVNWLTRSRSSSRYVQQPS